MTPVGVYSVLEAKYPELDFFTGLENGAATASNSNIGGSQVGRQRQRKRRYLCSRTIQAHLAQFAVIFLVM